MGQWLRDLFSESSTVSAMRVMAMLALIFACYLAAYGAYSTKDVTTMVGLFLGVAFTGKVTQKYME